MSKALARVANECILQWMRALNQMSARVTLHASDGAWVTTDCLIDDEGQLVETPVAQQGAAHPLRQPFSLTLQAADGSQGFIHVKPDDGAGPS